MWLSSQGGEGRGVEVGGWDTCFGGFFLLGPQGGKGRGPFLAVNYISTKDGEVI